jgi:RNA polymerase sigma factor (sigma-70 family)
VDEKEAQLVADCIKQKPDAQRQLYERFKVPMYRLCLRYAGNKAEAEDMLQDGFIRVFTELTQYRGDGALGGWIRQVILRTALQQLRKRIKSGTQVPEDHIPDLVVQPEFPEQDWNARHIIKLLQQLPEGYRTVFNLFVMEDFSHKEIAEILGISESTSKTQLFKAKAYLRKRLEKTSVN